MDHPKHKSSVEVSSILLRVLVPVTAHALRVMDLLIDSLEIS